MLQKVHGGQMIWFHGNRHREDLPNRHSWSNLRVQSDAGTRLNFHRRLSREGGCEAALMHAVTLRPVLVLKVQPASHGLAHLDTALVLRLEPHIHGCLHINGHVEAPDEELDGGRPKGEDQFFIIPLQGSGSGSLCCKLQLTADGDPGFLHLSSCWGTDADLPLLTPMAYVLHASYTYMHTYIYKYIFTYIYICICTHRCMC